MTDEQQVPLVEQLDSVPHGAYWREDTPNPLGVDTRHWPIGNLCELAAAHIREQDTRLARAEAAARLAIHALHEGGSKAQAEADHALHAFLAEQKGQP